MTKSHQCNILLLSLFQSVDFDRLQLNIQQIATA
jgi:hypothetical protein